MSGSASLQAYSDLNGQMYRQIVAFTNASVS